MIISRKKRPCENPECSKSTTEEVNGKFRSVVCNTCFDVISYEKPDIETNTKKNSDKVVLKPKVGDVGVFSQTNIITDNIKTTEVDNTTIKHKPNIKVVKTPPLPPLEINTLYNEDNFITMSRMKKGEVDYSFTSPPYNIGETIGGKKYKEFADSGSQQKYAEWQIKLVNELLRVTKHHVFYNTQIIANNRIAIFTMFDVFKYKIKELIIWDKKRAAPASAKGVMNSKFEVIIVFSNDEPLNRNFKDVEFHGTFDNIIKVEMATNRYAKKHKAVFPIDLPRLFMSTFGKKGDIWYDPFGGSGTTACAAIEENKNWVLSELSKEYCDEIIIPRINEYKLQTKLEFV